jgi:hypothetical protein
MTLYASKTPRDLNSDPHPIVWDGHSPYDQMRADTDMFRKGAPARFPGYSHRPRPEYDKPMHNEPNRLLIDFRYIDAGRGEYARWVRDFDEHPEFWQRQPGAGLFAGVTVGYEADHIAHARKVLTRLANLTKTES